MCKKYAFILIAFFYSALYLYSPTRQERSSAAVQLLSENVGFEHVRQVCGDDSRGTPLFLFYNMLLAYPPKNRFINSYKFYLL
jgi:hypothetical protein